MGAVRGQTRGTLLPPTTQQLPSCPSAPAIPSLPYIPFLPCHMALLAPTTLSHLAFCQPLCPHPHMVPTPPNIITKGPLHPKKKFEFFRVPSFLMSVSISPRMGSISPRVRENNNFHLAWKNSQKSNETRPIPSIRYLYESPKKL